MRAWRGWITIAALTFPVVLLSVGPACGAVIDWTRAVGDPGDREPYMSRGRGYVEVHKSELPGDHRQTAA